jgi:hypothetical protein
MADTQSPIFNKKATERLRSPDDLDKYVQVTNPSVWMVLFACLALLAGFLAWGIFGTVATNVSATGARTGEAVVCFLDADSAAAVTVGERAAVNGVPMTVESVSSSPISREEAAATVGSEYLASALAPNEWSYLVVLSGGDLTQLSEGVPLPVSITVESVAPISLIFGD